MKKKYISIIVPSYNSEDYLERCIDSLLPGGEDIEIIIVNDGSSDNTKVIADSYLKKYPKIIKVIHKENGGHGSGVNAGLEIATGEYFKVVDSDDWLELSAYKKLINKVKKVVDNKNNIDLFITNYVYNKISLNKTLEVNYKNIFESNKISTWNDMKRFKTGQYFMMHSFMYKTSVLRKSGLKLPEHTFYVDNIFTYQAMPYVNKLIYLDINLYQYFIGRDEQSVNEEVMVRRIDQQYKVTNIVLKLHNLNDIKNIKLRNYMLRHLSILFTISSVLTSLANNKEAEKLRKDLWNTLKKYNFKTYKKVKYRLENILFLLPHPFKNSVTKIGYKIAKKILMFA